MPDLSIVIINDNAEEYCKVFFQSLQFQNYDRKSVEVIFIDNYSEDQSVAIARKNYPDIWHKCETRVAHRAFLYNMGIKLRPLHNTRFVISIPQQ